MNTVKEHCDRCGRSTEHMMIDIKDGKESWMTAHLRCIECGTEKDVDINS